MRVSLLATTAMLASCGHNGRESADAADGIDATAMIDSAMAADSGPDADLVPGLVKATMLEPANNGQPQVGMPIVFINPDGMLAAEVVTDAQGKAQATMLAGGSVSAVWHSNVGLSQVETILDVKPGDDLVFGSQPTDAGNSGTFTVNFTPLPGTGNTYRVYASCVSVMTSSSSATLGFEPFCVQSTMEVQVHAFNSLAQSLGYLDDPSVPFVDGGSVTMGTNWQQLTGVSAQYANLPSGVTSMSWARDAPDSFGYETRVVGAASGSSWSASGQGPITTNARIHTMVVRGTSGGWVVSEKVAGSATSYNLDLAAKLLPRLSAPTLDPSTARITVPVDNAGTSGDAPDLFYADVTFSRTNPASDAGGPSTTGVEWWVFGPRAEDVTLPTLPADITEVNARAGDLLGTTHAWMADTDVTTFDDLRQNPWDSYVRMQDSRASTIWRESVSQSQ